MGNTILEAPEILAGITVVGIGSGGWLFMLLVRTRYSMVKRLMDIVLSFIAIIISMPLMLVLGLFTKLTSKGPIFYTQARIGKNDKPFKIIKFRTMHVNAEDETGPVWAKSDDQRVTALGYYIRRLHLDETPQFINILKGDMSLIGPRPERPFFVDSFKRQVQNYTHRLSVKPGLTGLAQVRYKYDESIDDVKKKLSYDLLYIRKMCFFLDLKVLFWTAGKIVSITKSLFAETRGISWMR